MSKNFKIRHIPNNSETTYEAFIFLEENKIIRKKIISLLNKSSFGTKNLPDAIDWHFAGTWKHIFSKQKKYQSNWKTKWKKSENLLRKSIALPILVKSKKSEIISQAKVINHIFKSL